jgi:peptidoglycan/LPS O-acetylase OafA/YrhL
MPARFVKGPSVCARPRTGHCFEVDVGVLRYHPALDGIRALSVLAVIAYHDDYRMARGGFLGVDAFFVLSGFLITTLLVLEYRRRTTISLSTFWARRARRLLPALLLVLAVAAVYVHRDVVAWDRASVRNDGLASLFYVANWRFIVTKHSYFELFASPSPFRHMWSLAIEEQFYIVWPLVTLLCLKLARGSVRLLAAVCAFGVVASTIVMATTFARHDPSRAYYGTDARAHSLLIGALLGLLLIVWKPETAARRVIGILGVLASAMIVIAWTQVSGTSASYYRGGSVLYAVAVALVITAALQHGPLRALLSLKPLVWTGRISYGLYLWHWPIDVWLVRSHLPIDDASLKLLRLALTFAAATASYYLLERPIRRMGARPHRRTRAFVPAVALALAMALAILVAAGAGAAGPPRYLVAFGHPAPCGDPSSAEAQQALETVRRADGSSTRPSTHRILLLGDSIACSFLPGFAAAAQHAGGVVDQGAVIGCGIVSDEVEATGGEHAMLGSETCHALVESTMSSALARSHPDVVVWFSSWERFNLRVGGRTIKAGTRRADELIVDRMENALPRLTANGARLAIVTIPPATEGSALGLHFTPGRETELRILHLDELLRSFVAHHQRNTLLVDLARLVCPNGVPCAPTVDGRRPRPDGTHFSPKGSAWAAQWVLRELVEKTPAASACP